MSQTDIDYGFGQEWFRYILTPEERERVVQFETNLHPPEFWEDTVSSCELHQMLSFLSIDSYGLLHAMVKNRLVDMVRVRRFLSGAMSSHRARNNPTVQKSYQS